MFFTLLLAAQSTSGAIAPQHSFGPDYIRTEVESGCGDQVLRIQFRNANLARGEVILVAINGHSVPGAASGLQARAANRYIDRIGVMNCGRDSQDPVISGVMELSAMASQRVGLPPRVYFRLRRVGGSWGISWD